MNENDIKLIPTQWIDLDQIDLNEGQIDGLPANPRTIDPIDFETLKRSITEHPEMLGLKTLLVYAWKGRYVDIDGNQRTKALRELGYTKAPCKVIPETGYDLQAIAIKANTNNGKWDTERLQADWDKDKLQEWGVELPEFKEPKADDEDGDDSDGNGYKIAYELVFNDEAEQTEFYDILRELKNRLRGYDTISERMIAALRFWRNNYEE